MSDGTLRQILRQYLELCTSGGGGGGLDGHLASNAVLEWKGVTVKGRSRIAKFMRHKQQDGLVQRFSTVQAVQPFEERDTHLSTICTPPENLIVHTTKAHPAENVGDQSYKESSSPDMNLSYETPPRANQLSTSEPPPLTAGREFLPLSSSDEEDDVPPPQLTPESPVRPSEPRQNAYSELQYLEAIGIVRSSYEPKHRSTRTSHHIPREESPPPSASSGDNPSTPPSTTVGPADARPDKRTKLKLSYRTHLQTAQPQFALIIYEDLTPRSSRVRRNLFCDDPEPVEPISPTVPSERAPSSTPSPEARPLPDTPPSPPPPVPSPPVQPGEITPPQTPLEPPGTPHRQRRIPPAGFRTSPRRSRAIMNIAMAAAEAAAADGSNGSSSSSSSSSGSGYNNNNNNILQTWPRKTHPGGGSPGGGSAAKHRKLGTGSTTTVRKPLRF